MNDENSKYSLKNIIYIFIDTVNKINWGWEILKGKQVNKLQGGTHGRIMQLTGISKDFTRVRPRKL